MGVEKTKIGVALDTDKERWKIDELPSRIRPTGCGRLENTLIDHLVFYV
jgi:hypothetical protein